MDKATLWWGSNLGREGWWITLPSGKVRMIHGLSICVTSGGGAKKAAEQAKQNLGFLGSLPGWMGVIELIPPPAHFKAGTDEQCDCGTL